MKKIKSIIIFLIVFLAVYGQKAVAHVRYLVDETRMHTSGGWDWDFLLSPLSEPLNVGLMVGTLVIVLVVYVLSQTLPILRKELTTIRTKADSYHIFTPWMLRLGLGTALIGFGISGALVSPILEGYFYLSFIQILLGFFVLSGFLVVPSAIGAMVLYIFALTQDWYVLGNLDFFAIAFALLILDNERPGIDDLIGLPNLSPCRALKCFVPLIMRVGVGGAMIILAIYEKFMNPHVSAIVIEEFGLIDVVPVSTAMWVLSVGITEIVIGLALIVGIRTRFVASVAFIVLGLSFFYFGEDVSSHITLFAALSVLFVTRGGAWSLDALFKFTNPHFTHSKTEVS